MAQWVTRDRDEAFDIVQDTMVKMVQRYAQRPKQEWKPLFYKILHNGIRDWQRRNWIRNRWRVWFTSRPHEEEGGSDTNWESLPDQTTPDPSAQLDYSRAVLALESGLQMLPLRQRQTFLLRAWEGLNVAETAEAMGCSTGSVKTHYSRAIHTLRRDLAAYEGLINER